MKNNFKLLLVIVAFLSVFSQSFASKIILGTANFNPTDVTNEIRNAINSTIDTVIIQNVGQPWIVQPITIFNRDGRTIIFEEGVILQAKSGAFTLANGTLFKLKDCSNFKIYGYGATFHMLKPEYTEGEHRHAIDLSDCNNITIAGLLVNDSGGDGLLITGYAGGTNNQNFSENIYVVDCVFDNNRRQGCSIISAKNVLIENCTFSNTKGTLPEAGIDIEPDSDTEFVQNVKIRKCRFTGNYGAGLTFGFYLLTAATAPIAVTVDDCYFSYNHHPTNIYSAAEIYYSEPKNENLRGLITFNRCFVNGSQWTAVGATKSAHSMPMIFNDCVFKNVSQSTTSIYNTPIWIEVQDYSDPINYLGGISFNNSTLEYNTNYKYAWVNGWNNSLGAKDINFNLTIIHPTLNTAANNSAFFSNVKTKVNCTQTISYLTAMPNNTITVKNLNNAPVFKLACTQKPILFERTTSTSFPIAFNYTLSGTAQNGLDFNRLNGFGLIKQNTTQRLDTLNVINPKLGILNSNLVLNATGDGNLSATGASFNTIINSGSCSILSITLASFSAKKQLNTNLISWQTATETNNSHFNLERSNNIVDFKIINTQKGQDNSQTPKYYSYTDAQNIEETVYYRLKQLDFDGKFSYSNIIALNATAGNTLVVYPNPFSNEINITLDAPFSASTKIYLYDMFGRNLALEILPNGNNVICKPNNLPTGSYVLKIITAKAVYNKVVIKN